MAEKEYIERDGVMQKFADHVRRSNNSDFAPVPTWNQAVQIVEDFPAADVQPVVRGKWEVRRDDFMKTYYDKCSICGKEYFGANVFNFCPNCGADMKEET